MCLPTSLALTYYTEYMHTCEHMLRTQWHTYTYTDLLGTQ
jgi:hypothetical protein